MAGINPAKRRALGHYPHAGQALFYGEFKCAKRNLPGNV
jgi:hypothetical protein